MIRRLLVPGLGFLLVAPAAVVHPLDEYVQATYITLEPDRVRLDLYLTPGVEVAERVVALIDRDRDGEVSAGESEAYAGTVLRGLSLRVDDRPFPLALVGVESAPAAALLAG